ncbi:hypothetical protein D3C72_1767390 [compost metagenome]
MRTTSVMTSSDVGWIAYSRPWRSFTRISSSPILVQRPVSCHSSAGCTSGISSSIPAALFISSRMMASTLRITRKPIGM